jgi:hypothetical protein
LNREDEEAVPRLGSIRAHFHRDQGFAHVREGREDIRLAALHSSAEDSDTPAAVATWSYSVKKQLDRYRAVDLKQKAVAELIDKAAPKTAASLRKKLVAIDELEQLVAVQKGRLEKVLVKEASLPSGILLKQVSDGAAY